ncbi:hypothetical protein [Spirosoma arcticum]
MSLDDLFAIVNPWFETGLLSESDKPAVQRVYTELTGDTGERCRTCASYWSDVLHTLRVHLKANGYQSMDMSNQEYIIREDTAYVQVHGLPHVYINKGTGKESASAQYLTDVIAKDLLKEKPDLADTIIKNPDYNPDSAKSGKPADAPAKPAARTATAAKPKSKAKAAVVEPSGAVVVTDMEATTPVPHTTTDPSTESAPENQSPKE